MYLNILTTGNGQCACTTEIKQLLGKMDRVQNSVAANNASNQSKLINQKECSQMGWGGRVVTPVVYCRWNF